jgi:hypothetical protein
MSCIISLYVIQVSHSFYPTSLSVPDALQRPSGVFVTSNRLFERLSGAVSKSNLLWCVTKRINSSELENHGDMYAPLHYLAAFPSFDGEQE